MSTVCECNKFEMVDNKDVFYMLREGSTPIIFDPVPTEGSMNLLTSGTIYNALENVDSGVTSVNGKTGAVVLDSGDIGYESTTVESELGTINSALSSLQSVTEIIDTASGAIASFPDGSGLPVRSLVAQINPVQSGTGDPSPDNIRPISGWTGLSGKRCGKNLLDESSIISGYTLTPDGLPTAESPRRLATGTPISVKGDNVTVSYTTTVNTVLFMYSLFKGNTLIERVANKANGSTIALKGADKMYLSWYDSQSSDITSGVVSKCMVSVGSTASTYEEYQGEPISVSFGRTVYGGTDEVISGNGTSTMVIYDGGDLTWTKVTGNNYRSFYAPTPQRIVYSASQSTIISSNYKSTYNNAASASEDCYVWANAAAPNNAIAVKDTAKANMTAEEFKTAMTGVQFLCVLDTPQTFTHEGQSVDTLVGQNNIWVDTGSVSVEYPADTKLYIDKKIAELAS